MVLQVSFPKEVPYSITGFHKETRNLTGKSGTSLENQEPHWKTRNLTGKPGTSLEKATKISLFQVNNY